MSANNVNNGGNIRSADDYLALNQTVPQNTSADGNGGSREIADTLGAIEVIAKVTTAIALADTKVLSITLKDSADDSTFASLNVLYTETASGATAVAVGTELGRYIIPSDANRYIKAVITSTDAAGTGAVEVFQNYLAR